MTIHTYLDLSTAHLRHPTVHTLRAALPVRGWPVTIAIATYDCGMFVTVPDLSNIEVFARASQLPGDLADVLTYAFALGAYLVRFDADGERIPTLPLYD